MAVIAQHIQVLHSQRLVHKLGGLPGLNGHAELRVHLAGRHGLVSVGINPRSQPQQYILLDPLGGGNALNGLQFPEAVHHKAAQPAVHGIGDVLVSLIVAVEKGPLHGEVRVDSRIHLAGGDHINGHSLFRHDAVDLLEAGRLAGIQGEAARPEPFFHRRPVSPAVGADLILVHQIQRRLILLRQVHRIHSGKGEPARFIDADVIAQHCSSSYHFLYPVYKVPLIRPAPSEQAAPKGANIFFLFFL